MEPMRAVLAAKFWNQEVESTNSLQAVVHSVPCEPPPLGLVRGSKLSRSQQLLLIQRVFGAPFVPSIEPPNAWNKKCGGVVLDRVIASAGGPNWWATVTGRARAQRFWWLEKQLGENINQTPEPLSPQEEERWWHRGKRLLDASLYALSTRSRFRMSPRTTLSMSSELDSLAGLFGDSEQPGPNQGPRQNPWRGRAGLRHKREGHDIILESAWHEHFVDREARYWEVPQVTTLDVASVGTTSGLRYRLGLHHSAGTPVECPKMDGSVLGGVPAGATPGLRAQAAMSVEREMHVWKPKQAACRRRQNKRPYNLLAARPHVTVSGLAGGLLCANLKKHVDDISSEPSTPPSTGAAALSLGPNGGPLTADMFVSLGVSAQYGLFQRPFLDHTKLSARLDIGAASSLLAATRHQENTPPARDTINGHVDKGLPTVSLSLQQQLIGPIRARVDSRFSLDPYELANSERPHLQEVTYGIDCALESLGAAKLVVWYSPSRREGMAELRILER
ncbi:hypothetical protein R1sor_020170 [Riccia sorocarpa]|uniref:Uncharacterized protein n=1 Tax=Riccia sorocarpa TaxID=122646 RepID=A0ABD3IEK1_9MARC